MFVVFKCTIYHLEIENLGVPICTRSVPLGCLWNDVQWSSVFTRVDNEFQLVWPLQTKPKRGLADMCVIALTTHVEELPIKSEALIQFLFNEIRPGKGNRALAR